MSYVIVVKGEFFNNEHHSIDRSQVRMNGMKEMNVRREEQLAEKKKMKMMMKTNTAKRKQMKLWFMREKRNETDLERTKEKEKEDQQL